MYSEAERKTVKGMDAAMRNKKYGNMRISVKIAIIFLVLICIFWGIIFLQFYYSNSRESREYAETLLDQTLNTVSRNVMTLIENVAYDSRLILSSSDITDALKSGDLEQQKDSLYQFISLIDFETHINGIYIMDMYQNVCSIDRSSVRTLRTEGPDRIRWYDEVMALQGSFCLKVNADRVLTQSSMSTMVSLIRAVINPQDFLPVGILMINIDLSAFEDCYSSISQEHVPIIYILDDTGKIVVSRSETKLPKLQKKLEQAEQTGELTEADGILYGKRTIEANGWQILTGAEIRNTSAADENTKYVLIFGSGMLTVFGLICYMLMHQYVTIPLRQVVGFMNQMRGKRFQKLELSQHGRDSYLELEILKGTYNQMVDEIDRLIERVYEEERIKRKTELNILQEQIKPHFLYNTIDAMSYLALADKNERLYEALEAFGGYYRTLLSKGKEWITVEEEMEMARDYLELQKLRYGDMIRYELRIENSMKKKRMLKMILQPFIENSVSHGIRQKETPGTVQVKGWGEAGCLHFQIIDDGVGIPQEIIEKLGSAHISRNEKSFGMRGTIERMKIFYESDLRYEIRSEVGKGTLIELVVPELENQEEQMG